MEASIWIYPWDILDYGMERTLGILKSMRLTGLSVAINYHAAKLLLPHNPHRKIYFPEPDMLYFPPDPRFYPESFRPLESSETKGSNFLTQLIQKAHEFEMDVTAWTIGMHNSHLGFLHPETTIETALGDHLLHSLCPSNPSVRAYVQGLVTDLTSHFDLSAIELEAPGFMRFTHGYHHEMYGIEMSPSLDFLLSLCFCPYCMREASAAGVNVEVLRKAVRSYIKRELDGPYLPKAPQNLLGAIPELEEFVEWRVQMMSNWIATLKGSMRRNRRLSIIPTTSPPTSEARLLIGTDPTKIAQIADSITVCGYFSSKNKLAEDLDMLLAEGVPPEKMRVGLRPQAPDSHSFEDFVTKLGVVAERKLAGVSFYNFGQMRATSFDWIRQGLREVQK